MCLRGGGWSVGAGKLRQKLMPGVVGSCDSEAKPSQACLFGPCPLQLRISGWQRLIGPAWPSAHPLTKCGRSLPDISAPRLVFIGRRGYWGNTCKAWCSGCEERKWMPGGRPNRWRHQGKGLGSGARI